MYITNQGYKPWYKNSISDNNNNNNIYCVLNVIIVD